MDIPDLHMCNESTSSYFIKISKDKIVQLDLRPFLTQSQLDSGSETNWLKQNNLEELLQLLRPLLSSCQECKAENDTKKSASSKDCVLTGDTVRVACSFKKQPTENVCLLTNFSSNKKKGESGFSEVLLHHEKIVAYICPRSSCTTLPPLPVHLSQLNVNVESDKGRPIQDISKYFNAQ